MSSPAEVMTRAEPVSALVPHNMDSAIRLAEMMSGASLVPDHLKGKPSDCLLVIEQATRWRMSPFAVAQCTSVIRGKCMFEGKLVAAALHTSGIIAGRLNYEFSGIGPTRSVEVTATLRGETEARKVTVSFAEARTDNGAWKSQPDQQLCYSGARVWARRHAPEVMLGVYTPDEDFGEIPINGDAGAGATTGAGASNSDAGAGKKKDGKPLYSAADFEKNLPSWTELVKTNKKTPQAIIATVSARSTMTAEQIEAINKLSVTQTTGGANENA